MHRIEIRLSPSSSRMIFDFSETVRPSKWEALRNSTFLIIDEDHHRLSCFALDDDVIEAGFFQIWRCVAAGA